MPRPRPLSPTEASRTLAHRLGIRIAPRLRQFATRFGLRSKRVFLVWTKWSDGERGAGDEVVQARVELLPTPRVSDLTSIALSPFSAGVLPVGSLRVDLVSVEYTYDQLRGKAVPGRDVGDLVPSEWSFFYEVAEDGRGDKEPERMRYRLAGLPNRREGSVEWSLVLEPMVEQMARDGSSQVGIDRDF